MKTTKLFDYRTKTMIAEIPAKDFAKWCERWLHADSIRKAA